MKAWLVIIRTANSPPVGASVVSIFVSEESNMNALVKKAGEMWKGCKVWFVPLTEVKEPDETL